MTGFVVGWNLEETFQAINRDYEFVAFVATDFPVIFPYDCGEDV